ncbi:MAG: siroheme synthase CysG [Pseudomonadales bacterium]
MPLNPSLNLAPGPSTGLPLSFDLEDKCCLLIGGCGQALPNARSLAKAGAILHVFSHGVVEQELVELTNNSGGTLNLFDSNVDLLSAVRDSQWLATAILCVVAVEDIAVSKKFAAFCKEQTLLINVLDRPSLSSVTFPELVDRGSLKIAISSSGRAPVLSRLLRQKLETLLPFEYGSLNELAAEFGPLVAKVLPDKQGRQRFWEAILDGPVAELVFSGRIQQAKTKLNEMLEHHSELSLDGEVFLVGAGPGDPELLTLKALRLMQLADVVIYDRLVSPEILELVSRDAKRLYVGKQRAEHSTSQQGINDLLLKHAVAGERVLRLKGGDPFIFGRGGEEIEHLAQHNINFQVVPGITAASGCACYAGIPLTHRDHAQSVRFVTGHLKNGSPNLPWHEFIDAHQTLVFYMSLVGLPDISARMIEHGRSPDTPTALIQQGTTSKQRVISGTLAEIPALAKQHKIQAPTITIVGSVVELREKLTWFTPNDQVE